MSSNKRCGQEVLEKMFRMQMKTTGDTIHTHEKERLRLQCGTTSTVGENVADWTHRHFWSSRVTVRPLGKLFPYMLNRKLWEDCQFTLWYLPRKIKAHVCTETCAWMFSAAVSVTAKNWNENKCPPAGDSINKLRHFCTVAYFSATKRSWHAPQHGDIKITMVSERHQRKEFILYDSIHVKF